MCISSLWYHSGHVDCITLIERSNSKINVICSNVVHIGGLAFIY